jgi:tetratricopeptide (TPR) repeat protein
MRHSISTNKRGAFHTTMVKSFGSLRKFFDVSNSRTWIFTRAKVPRKPGFERFSFAAASKSVRTCFASLREIFRMSVVALPRRVLRGDIHLSFGCGSAALGLLVLGASVTVFSVGSAAGQGDPTEKLPMYGQPGIARPENLKKFDEDFIRDATFRFGSRGAASRVLSEQGWESFRKGMLDVAMRRFNEAWLLNPKNYQVFWGFGAVLSEQGKLTAAIEQLETARELIDDPKQKVLLLSDRGTVHSVYGVRLPVERQLERAQHFVIANNSFAESLEIDPNNARSWRDWAISLYEQERYSEAWVKAKRAIELKARPFPANFLENLKKKVPEAK